ncbi:hypothetical protein [Nocardia camponoti]|uniref:Uncharacterized protein n=1 Tax=Nocardia camponoti TaxID=1616106 RepID=A0A917QM43_9NOCA|nr:hypothetical protein [Nocardia camponoti]GGK57609.1 hypothetical protein GCM10011591_32230 [Nocardia camponoti]
MAIAAPGTDVSALERRVAADRTATRSQDPLDFLRLATSLTELAQALVATHNDPSSRDRIAEALEPSQEAVAIRLHWLVAGYVSYEYAGALQDSLRLFEQATRLVGHRQLATNTIRSATQAYRQVANDYPDVSPMCADGLSKCGVWLTRLDHTSAVAATEDAARIRAARFAIDGVGPGKYLASLSTLLRTMMVGRSRKQAIASYRAIYAEITSTATTAKLRETPVEELDLTLKTSQALIKLGAPTLEKAGRLTQQQILYQSGGDLATIDEINWRLALVGLKPLAAGAMPEPPSRPVEITATYGAIAVRCSAPDALAQVRAAIIAAFERDDVAPVEAGRFAGVHERHWGVKEPEVNSATELATDVILVEQSSGSWISVKSLNWEIGALAKHPLALRLSEKWPTLTVATIENISYELCLYENGVATQYAALGRPTGQAPLDAPLRPLDFATLADYGADYASETQVRAAFGNAPMFAKVTELPASGIRQAAEANPLTSYGDNILFFGTP